MVSLLTVFTLAVAALAATPSPQSLNSDVLLLINDDLQGMSSAFADSAVIVLDAQAYESAAPSCQALGEQLWSPALNTSSIQPGLDYLKYEQQINNRTKFWIAPSAGCNTSRTIDGSGSVGSADPKSKYQVLCTQTAPFSDPNTANTSSTWQIAVNSNNETYVGFRDRLSFRFQGIRYAAQPERFTYSTPYEGSGETVDATQFGNICVQFGEGSEDCLFLNIWTPYLPNTAGSSEDSTPLKPVMFWIHGGAFTSGMSSDPTFDGGHFTARGDVVMVAINYRLGSLGFLALDDGTTKGNYGFADQITALDWVRANIKDFGGDPDRITIFGQSAGAGSVRAMMASPKALGKFAGAIMLSNLGGIQYGTTYSLYYTIPQEVEVVANAILADTNCASAASQVDCLRQVPAYTLNGLNDVARYLVVDGTYLTANQLPLGGPKAPYELMMGTMRDDGGPIVSYPAPGTTNLSLALQQQGLPADAPASLFPEPTGANITLDIFNVTARVDTDGVFRCIDQATAYAGLQSGLFDQVHYYEFNRSYQTTGWPGEDVCQPPVTPSHPYGDPSGEYFKCHSGELYFVFGQIARMGLPLRDENDLPFAQFALDAFTAFGRTYDPNPDKRFLEARGFNSSLWELDTAGSWQPSTKESMTMRRLQWPSEQSGLIEQAQCDWLNLSLTYYTSGPGAQTS